MLQRLLVHVYCSKNLEIGIKLHTNPSKNSALKKVVMVTEKIKLAYMLERYKQLKSPASL